MPTASPEKRTRTVSQGLVFHHRSSPKPRNAGRANSRPMVVMREPHPCRWREQTACRVRHSHTSPASPRSPSSRAKSLSSRASNRLIRGRGQAGKPLETNGHRQGGSLRTSGFFIQCQIPLSTTQKLLREIFHKVLGVALRIEHPARREARRRSAADPDACCRQGATHLWQDPSGRPEMSVFEHEIANRH